MTTIRTYKIQLVSLSFLIYITALCLTKNTFAADELHTDKWKATGDKALLEQREYRSSMDTSFDLVLSADYRKDNLTWNEANANGTVNIMSELKWENLDIAQTSAAARLNFFSDWHVRGRVGYGSIYSGSNQDSDYNGNNRTLEFSRSNNRGGGEVRDASIGLGKTLRLLDIAGENILSLSPLMGISTHQQNLTMTDGFQTLTSDGSGLGPYEGLNNSYDTQWQGPWVGIESVLKTGEHWSLNATAEYHWADYTAHANWNLRSNFSHPVSFVHNANGQGILLSAGVTYLVTKNSSIRLAVEEQQWHTDAGIDRTFYTDGTVGYYILNSVQWNTSAFKLEMHHYF